MSNRQSKFIEYPQRFLLGAVDIYVRLVSIIVALALAGSILYVVIYLPLAWLYRLVTG